MSVNLKPAFSDVYYYSIECLRDKMSFESVRYPSSVNFESTVFCSSFYVLKVTIVGEGQCSTCVHCFGFHNRAVMSNVCVYALAHYIMIKTLYACLLYRTFSQQAVKHGY